MNTKRENRQKKRQQRKIRRERSNFLRIASWSALVVLMISACLLGAAVLHGSSVEKKRKMAEGRAALGAILASSSVTGTSDVPIFNTIDVVRFIADEPPEFYEKLWETQLRGILDTVMLADNFLGQEIRSLEEAVRGRYGMSLMVAVNTDASAYSNGNLQGFAADVVDGQPVLTVSAQYMNAVQQCLRATYPETWMDALYVDISIIIYHELNHLAFANEWDISKITDEVFFVEETRAWSDTCRVMIDPVVLSKGHAISSGHYDYWQAWVRDGRQPSGKFLAATLRSSFPR